MASKCSPHSLPIDGYPRTWLVLGSFFGATGKNMPTAFIDESGAAPSTGLLQAKHKWRTIESPVPTVDFMRDAPFLDTFNNCCAYGHVYLYVPTARQASLLLGSDDGIAVWLNGRREFAIEAMRACVPDENIVPVHLLEGWNRMLVKVTQYGGMWAFAVRVVSTSRTPMSDLGYSLDSPLRGRKLPMAPQPMPLVLSVSTPQSTAAIEQSHGAPVRFFVTVTNQSGTATAPGVIAISMGSTHLKSLDLPALAVGCTHAVDFELPYDTWLAAWKTPLQIQARSKERARSIAVALSNDPASAFLMTTAGNNDWLGATDRSQLSIIRTDLVAGPGVASECRNLSAHLAAFIEAAKRGDRREASRSLRLVDQSIVDKSKAAKRGSVYPTGHAHIDMNWLWRWPETVQVCQDTFRQALRFMQEFPEFKFSQSQASVYDAIEREDPTLFAGIKKAVARGSWDITGGMWTEGDTNLSSGEALCRSFLLGQRYFREKFGVTARVGWLPDNFGHAGQLPQIMRLAQIDAFYHMRCSPPVQLYWWEGIDGSRVLAKTGQGYSDQITPTIRREPDRLPNETPSQLFVYGVGDHGGGPTRRDITTARSYQKNRLFPTMRFAAAAEYFDDMKPKAEAAHVHHGELQYIFEGCYTNVSRIKQGNRATENALEAAETLAVVAHRLGLAYPRHELHEAWKILVFNEFHDILPGSAIHESNADSVAKYYQALEICRTIRLRSIRFIGEKIGIATDNAIPIMVFNPHAWTNSDVAVAEVVVNDQCAEFVVRDLEGNAVAAQVVRSRRYDVDNHYWLQFVADRVPGLGYKVFFVEPRTVGTAIPVTHWLNPYPVLPVVHAVTGKSLSLQGHRIRNRFFEVVYDGNDGRLRSLKLISKGHLGAELLAPSGANRLAIYREHPHDMSAWNLDPGASGPHPVTVTQRASVVSAGPESIAWITKFSYGESTFALTTTVHADSPRIDSHLAVEWLERGTATTDAPMLRVVHGLKAVPKSLTCDVPFAVLDRPTGREVPAQKWVDVRLSTGGLCLMNQGKYGHSIHGSDLRLTLLRSAYDPDLLPDVGRHEIVWSLFPHDRTFTNAALAKLGASYNVPFEIFQLRKQHGTLGLEHSYLSTDSETFVVTGIKRAEDQDGVVVRGYDATGDKSLVAIRTDFPSAHSYRTNILEDRMAGLPLKIGKRSVSAPMKPWEIATIKLC